MASPIRILKSTTSGNIPASLAIGEIGINEADQTLFHRDGTGAVRSLDLRSGHLMSVYNSADSGAYTTALTAAPFNTIEYQRSAFNATLAGNIVTINEDIPNLLVEFGVGVEHTTGTRANFRHRVIHGGSGPGQISRSSAFSYIRSQATATDGTTGMGWCVIPITTGDTVGVSSVRIASTATGRMVADGCRMKLTRLP